MAEWISVKDRMPDFDVDVLVYAIGILDSFVGTVSIDITSYTDRKYGYNITGWRSPRQYYFDDYRITHWVKLPEPPKEDE
jgi:hypothetical protein